MTIRDWLPRFANFASGSTRSTARKPISMPAWNPCRPPADPFSICNRYRYAVPGSAAGKKNGTETIDRRILIWYRFAPRGSDLVERSGTEMLIKFEADDGLAEA